ncbi:MAG: hypothetical protein Q9160_003328 [Pyrenula sp. 1 TL-2023]
MDDSVEEIPQSIDPYQILGIAQDVTAEQIKSAYRKQALKNHPDKVPADIKDEAKKKFQDIAFAYAILSDERRRRRYDNTGNTSESLDLEDDDFNWVDFFKEQYAAVVTADAIERIKKDYQGSDEERQDLLDAFARHEGNIDLVFEDVMCSSVLDDEERFRSIIDEAIKEGDAELWEDYKRETKAKRKQRMKNAKREAAEAEEMAEELGVKDKLFGSAAGGSSRKKKNESDDNALAALIQQRQKSRAATFLDDLEAKYGGGNKAKAGNKRRSEDETPEEVFQRNAARTGKKSRSARGKS